MIAALAAAALAGLPVDCRVCANSDFDNYTATFVQSEECLTCTNGDQFQALPIVRLYKRPNAESNGAQHPTRTPG
jgi:hypothetical protein